MPKLPGISSQTLLGGSIRCLTAGQDDFDARKGPRVHPGHSAERGLGTAGNQPIDRIHVPIAGRSVTRVSHTASGTLSASPTYHAGPRAARAAPAPHKRTISPTAATSLGFILRRLLSESHDQGAGRRRQQHLSRRPATHWLQPQSLRWSVGPHRAGTSRDQVFAHPIR